MISPPRVPERRFNNMFNVQCEALLLQIYVRDYWDLNIYKRAIRESEMQIQRGDVREWCLSIELTQQAST